MIPTESKPKTLNKPRADLAADLESLIRHRILTLFIQTHFMAISQSHSEIDSGLWSLIHRSPARGCFHGRR
ncbi:hypothetical protein [Sphingobium yanoikuyae]|jgi:hypothetical protein|uniref:Uncharacterized protein n=1 Tax=Sphingobium yanoikuyae TaxID=13690 RepID=A0A9X7YEK3_SPHYA|nr:hypothetical protein [Sphingobium yanoikuyae]QNG47742.1 hypothetical protein H3V42_09270 [Sphingobium yanoikuyae]